MLAALDDAVIDDKKGAFPFWVALNLVDNYFFFAGQAVFLIIYFFCMAAGRRYGPAQVRAPGVGDSSGLCLRVRAAAPGGAVAAAKSAYHRPVQRVRVSVLRQIPAVRRNFLQHPAHARRALFQGPVSGGHPQAHEPDGLSAAGRCRGRAGVLPRKGAPPVHLRFKGLCRLCVCAGAEQRVLCAQLELLRAVVLYADSGFVRCNVLSALPPGAGRAASAAGAADDDLPDADGGGVRRCAGQGRRRQHGLWRAGRARAVLGYLRHDDAGDRDFCAAVAFLPQ